MPVIALVKREPSMLTSALPPVVVADPDPMYQREIVRLLCSDFRCLVTSALAETYQAIWNVKPVLLSLELVFPDGDGLTLIQQMQADEALRQTLIACVTTRAAIKDKILAFRAGADDYFVKPLVPAMNYSGRMLLLRQTGHIARLAR